MRLIHWCILSTVAGSATALTGCNLLERRVAGPSAPVPAVEVEVVTVRASGARPVIELPGTVVAERAATLAAPVAGQVRLLVQEGAQLAAGAQAALLDAAGLPAQMEMARAALDAAERRRASARTAVDQAARDAETTGASLAQTLRAAEAERCRRQALLEEVKLQAQTEPVRARAQLQAAEARLRRLRSGEREERIRQIEAELKFVRAELNVAQSQRQRKEELLSKGYVSASDLEGARLAQERAEADVQQREEQLRLMQNSTHPEDVREAEQQVEVARRAWRATAGMAQQVAQRRAELAGAEAEVVKVRQSLQAVRTNRLAITRARQDAEAADAEARRWQAELAQVGDQLSRTIVRAPFAGQVLRRHARPGETVMTGRALLDLVDVRRMGFEATLSDRESSHLSNGLRVQVLVPAVSHGPLAGRIVEVTPGSDPARPTYAARIQLAAPPGLRPGMGGTARIPLGPTVTRLRLPLDSLRRHFPRDSRGEVLVVEGSRLSPRTVRLGAASGSFVTVEGGLAEGDRVVISDTRALPLDGPVRAEERNES